MDLTRRQIARLVTALYVTGGLLLLYDYLGDPHGEGTHLPLAWHVFPVSVVASLIAFLTDMSAPLDPAWFIPVETATAAFGFSVALCAAVLRRIISGGSVLTAEDIGDRNKPPENVAD